MKKDKGFEKKEKEDAGVNEGLQKKHAESNARKTTGEEQDEDMSDDEEDTAEEETKAAQSIAYADKGEETDEDSEAEEVATKHAGTGDEMTPDAAENETESLIGRREGSAASGSKKRSSDKGRKGDTKEKSASSNKNMPKRKQSK